MNVKQQNILKKIDSFLALLSRSEILLNDAEKLRISQTTQSYKPTAKKKKRVRFCCYDISTVTMPNYGDLDSITQLKQISRLMVQSAKISSKLFAIKSDTSWTRKSLKQFIEELKAYICNLRSNETQNNLKRINVATYLLIQFEDSFSRKIAYPFAERVCNLLSSSIRFYLKTIWNAIEFLNGSRGGKNIKIPKWYTQIGTFSVFNDDNNNATGSGVLMDENSEFIPYHAAEISINLENLYYLKRSESESMCVEDMMKELGIIDNPYIFFSEMKQVLENTNHAIYGSMTTTKKKKKRGEFDKYLQAKWKELRAVLKDVEDTHSTRLDFYLPLKDLKQFLVDLKGNDGSMDVDS